jgi:hypothetical protein
MTKATEPLPFKTHTPALSETTIVRIRAAARRFVQSGGSIFPAPLTDVSEHIGNIERELRRTASRAFKQELDKTDFSDPDARRRISDAAIAIATEREDAAFLFGAFVGLEIAALTIGPVTTVPKGRIARRKPGGARTS